MKLILSTFAAASLMSSAAMAFEFTGGNLVLIERQVSFTESEDDGYHQADAQATIAYTFGNGFGGQAGLSFGNYDGEDGYRSAELHLTYAMAPNLTFGTFIGQETYGLGASDDKENYGFYGLEAAYTKNALIVQTAVEYEKNTDGVEYRHTALMLDASYGLSEKVSITAGLHVLNSTWDDGPDYTLQYAYVGVGYAITPQLDLSTAFGRMIGKETYDKQKNMMVSLTYNFSNTALFHQRSYSSVIPGN